MDLPDDIKNTLPETLTQIGGLNKNNWYTWKEKYAPLHKALTEMGSEAAESFTPFLEPYETASQNEKQAIGAIVILRDLMLTDAAASIALYRDHADETLSELAQSTYDTFEGSRILDEEGDDPANRVRKLVEIMFFGKASFTIKSNAQKALRDLPQDRVIQALTDAYPRAESEQQEDIILQLISRTSKADLFSDEAVISILRATFDRHPTPKMLGSNGKSIRNGLERILSPEAFAEWEVGYLEAIQRYEEESKRRQEAQERELAIKQREYEARQKQDAEKKRPRYEKLVRDMSLAKSRRIEERIQLYETIKGLKPGEKLVTIDVVLDFISAPEKLIVEAEPEPAPPPPEPKPEPKPESEQKSGGLGGFIKKLFGQDEVEEASQPKPEPPQPVIPRREEPSLEMVVEVLGFLEAIDTLKELQNHDNPVVQSTAARLLRDLTVYQIPSIPAAIQQKAESIALMVAAPDGAARVEGQHYMAEVGRDNVVAVLIRMLADSSADTKQRQRILRTLESLGSAAGMKAIGAARFDPNPEIAKLAKELHH